MFLNDVSFSFFCHRFNLGWLGSVCVVGFLFAYDVGWLLDIKYFFVLLCAVDSWVVWMILCVRCGCWLVSQVDSLRCCRGFLEWLFIYLHGDTLFLPCTFFFTFSCLFVSKAIIYHAFLLLRFECWIRLGWRIIVVAGALLLSRSVLLVCCCCSWRVSQDTCFFLFSLTGSHYE